MSTFRKMPHIRVLDGWRGISILLVVMGHLLPLGPKKWQINSMVVTAGMAIFFCLSGFLITSTLIYRPSVRDFLIRRLCRILPLSWAYSIVVITALHAGGKTLIAQLFFYSNYPPYPLTALTGHLWSLCVEVQFYLTVALLFALLRRRGLLLLPLLCLMVTTARIITHTQISIVTHLRVDEILSGACLALAVESSRFSRIKQVLCSSWLPMALIPLAFASAAASSGPLPYLRPYLVTFMVGQTILLAPGWLARLLTSKKLAFVAEISYALYILHPLCTVGWLTTPSKLLRYVLRIPAIGAVTIAATLSTRFYEHWWIVLGKRWSRNPKFEPVSQPLQDAVEFAVPEPPN